MKHIKIYDNKIVGSYVKLNYINYDVYENKNIKKYFNTQDVYIIISDDKEDDYYPYEIANGKMSIWVEEKQIRSALPHEITAMKYNL